MTLVAAVPVCHPSITSLSKVYQGVRLAAITHGRAKVARVSVGIHISHVPVGVHRWLTLRTLCTGSPSSLASRRYIRASRAGPPAARRLGRALPPGASRTLCAACDR